jgi:hypothetical protein
MRDQTALLIALRAAGHTPDEITTMLDGWVWLGDLSGMEVVPIDRDGVTMAHPGVAVSHRCGKGTWEQPADGMSADGASLLGNLVLRAVDARQFHACSPQGSL